MFLELWLIGTILAKMTSSHLSTSLGLSSEHKLYFHCNLQCIVFTSHKKDHMIEIFLDAQKKLNKKGLWLFHLEK